ncbi:MAG: hypothetical protein KAQ65_10985 [Candidatus Thorarchaeota archaeon]|nr:hypothetical protein [Candidatus Thorarchaeota archaeon]
MSISEIWSNLYSNNSKLQAFAVVENSKIVWQTDNWNLVDAVDHIMDVCTNAKKSLKVADVIYTTVRASEDSYIASSSDNQGHILMAQIHHNNGIWLMAWATADSDPDLAIIDLLYAATKMVSL